VIHLRLQFLHLNFPRRSSQGLLPTPLSPLETPCLSRRVFVSGPSTDARGWNSRHCRSKLSRAALGFPSVPNSSSSVALGADPPSLLTAPFGSGTDFPALYRAGGTETTGVSWAGKRGINHRPSLCYQRRNPQTPVKPNYPPTARMGTSRFKQTLLSVRWRDPRHTEPETNPKAASQHQNEPCPPAPRPLTVPRGEPGLPAPLLQPKGAELPAGASIGPGPLPLAASPAGQRTGTRSRQGRRATTPRVPAAPSETKAAAYVPAAAAARPAQRPAIFLCLPTGVKHSLPVNSSRVYYQISKILHFLLYPNSLYCVWQYR